MKKIIVLLILASILVACKSSSGGHCDAYGNKSGSIKTKKTIV